MKRKIKSLNLLFVFLIAAGAWSGEIVPWFDDGDALVDYTAAFDETGSDITSLNPASKITFAAKFTPAELDVTEETGPVLLIETGGSKFGSGLYICNGEIVYALRTSGNSSDRELTDLDGSDGSSSVAMGKALEGQENKVYASLDLTTGMVFSSVNGVRKINYLYNAPTSTNLTGNQAVTFLGDTGLGSTGGLAGTNPLLSDSNAWMFSGIAGAPVRGQIFNQAVNPSVMANTPSPQVNEENIDPAVISEVSFNTAEDPENAGSQNPDVTGHFVTFYEGTGADPNLSLPELYGTFVPAGTDPISVTVNSPETFELDLGQTIYWRVEEQISGAPEGDAGNVTGPFWGFETLPPKPAADIQPEDEAVFADQQAVFEFTFTSKSAASAAWFKEGDPDTELLESDPDVTIDLVQNGDEYTSTLSIANPEAADEGYYYCTAENDFGTADSESVSMAVKRMVVYWPFDGDYIDYSGEGNDITPYADPVPEQWVDGVDPAKTGQAISTIGNRESAGETDPLNVAEYTNEITVSVWLKWPGPDSFSTLNYRQIVCSMDDSENSFFLEIDNRDGWILINAPGYSPYPFYQIARNEWTHIAFTASADEVAAVYVNGSQYDITEPGRYSINQVSKPIFFASDFEDSENLNNVLEAVFDDVRIYNYAMSPEEIAGIYYDVSGEQICVEPNADNLKYDFNGDCTVDFDDLAALSIDWLNDKLYLSSLE
ncbi:Immunoglobulin I-set domain protein [Sedimentisphaera cyanobacteriorum]|uniref:Immunoglobulin I-set domain protein n=1 Tax=Sedimentisphaera cyanobacteriorum TaxID=1940790 RepID=A0A1Q2HPW4_9BACT|nr:LamG-like jellyroll fold domain-containing protein [Sedimentisphaera cyanobacteriorum]AQQ09509.1 Immunoglobulin I-set domain protein [Sedimentisphaera cyanobacteriorum]